MRKLGTAAAALAVLTLSAAPAIAAAPTSAARLSVAKSVRTGAATKGKSDQLGGGALIGIGLAVAAVIAIVVIASDGNNNSSSS